MIFTNRQQAGILLAKKLTLYKGTSSVILGLARGGVVIAQAISSQLNLPLDVLVIKKMSTTSDPELAIGAVAPDDVSFIDWKLAQRLGIDEYTIQKELKPQLSQIINERTAMYRRGKKPFNAKSKPLLLVDDGVATGATMRAAVLWAKKKHAGKIVVAVPVAPPGFISVMRHEVDALEVLDTPNDFHAVGQFYKDFPQVDDEEVVQLLAES